MERTPSKKLTASHALIFFRRDCLDTFATKLAAPMRSREMPQLTMAVRGRRVAVFFVMPTIRLKDAHVQHTILITSTRTAAESILKVIQLSPTYGELLVSRDCESLTLIHHKRRPMLAARRLSRCASILFSLEMPQSGSGKVLCLISKVIEDSGSVITIKLSRLLRVNSDFFPRISFSTDIGNLNAFRYEISS